jgi:glycogen synthase
VSTRAAMRVARLCSVFEPPAAAVTGRARRFDPIGGMQNHAACLTRALDARGIEQHVVTTRPPGAPAVHRIGDRASVHRLGLPVPWARQCYAPFAAARLHALARDCDVLHAHLGEDLAVIPVALSVARRHRIPLVLTVHMSLTHTFVATTTRTHAVSALGAPLERLGVRAADAVIALTPRLAERLARSGVATDRVRVIPSGVEPARFAPPAVDDRPPRRGPPRVGYVGRLCRQKGVATLMDAFGRLLHGEARLVLVGDGPARRALERRAARRGVAGRVEFAGFRHHDEIPALLRSLDVMVLPSLCEELGSVLVEGMQAGLPIVASRTGGIPDAIGDAGVLVDPGDAGRLATALDRLLGDPAARAALGARARRRATRFDWERLAGEVLDVYDAVVHRRRAAVADGLDRARVAVPSLPR